MALACLERGAPEHIRSDQGPEFIAKAVREWIAAVGTRTAFIEKASPWENGYCESFNGKLRDELLNGETGQQIAVLRHGGPIGRVRIAGNGELIVLAGHKEGSAYPYTYRLTICDGLSGALLATLRANDDFPTLSSDGRAVVTQINGKLALLARESGFQPRPLPDADELTSSDLMGAIQTGFATRRILANYARRVEVRDFRDGRIIRELPGAEISQSDDGRRFVVFDSLEDARKSQLGGAVEVAKNLEIGVYDSASLRLLCSLPRPTGFADASLSPNGRFLVIGKDLYEAAPAESSTSVAAAAKARSAALSPQRRQEIQKLFFEAFEAFKAGRFADAQRDFVKGLEIDPANAQAHFSLAETYLRLEQPALAKQHFNRTIEFAPNSREAALARERLR